MTYDVAVVGGGITGLAAAWEAHKQGADVVVLDAADQAGGKLRTSPVAGIPVDESADAFLARVPEAIDLCTELGIQDELVAPATGRAYIWAQSGRTGLTSAAGHTGRIELRPLPKDQLLGIPTDLDGVAASGILSPEALARAAEDVSSASGPGQATAVPSSSQTGVTKPPPPRLEVGVVTVPSSGRDHRHGQEGKPAPASREQAASSESGEDVSVGELVRGRLGDEVYELLVAPLIGGIWAGDADRLSVEVAAPALAEARRRDASLIRGAQAVRAAAASAGAADNPVFLAPRSGMGRLVDALTERLGRRIHLGQPVEKIQKVPLTSSDLGQAPDERAEDASGTDDLDDRSLAGGRAHRGDPREGPDWQLHMADGSTVTARAVVIATPASAAARLLEAHSPRAAQILASIEHSPVTLTTLAVPRDRIEHPLDGSGFLVPPKAGLLLTACSWASSKWPHLAGGGPGDEAGSPAAGNQPRPPAGDVVLLRASAGRDGNERAMQLSDEELLRTLLADLRLTMGLRAEPADLVDVRVSRWAQGFPQPRPGHLARIADLERALAEDTPNLAAAGAWARGVGIPACIRSGRAATIEVLRR